MPFLTGYGGWVFDESGKPRPALDTPESVAAYQFVRRPSSSPPGAARNQRLRSGRRPVPGEQGGDDHQWRLELAELCVAEGIDAAVAPLPLVASTGQPMAAHDRRQGILPDRRRPGTGRRRRHATGSVSDAAATQREYLAQQTLLPFAARPVENAPAVGDSTLQASRRPARRTVV